MSGPDVLVVDNSEFFADVVTSRLEDEHGMVTTIATSPEEALARLDDQRVDCIVANYEMPDTDGLGFYERVRGRGHDQPFVLFTGKRADGLAREALEEAGVTLFMRKQHTTEGFDLLANRIRLAVAAEG